LARAGVTSRRKAIDLIKQGLVKVNGEPVSNPWTSVNHLHDKITVCGKEVKIPKKLIYIMLNKPKGIITTFKDEFERKTILNIIPDIDGLVPAGRLDEHSEGLIIITNDGHLVHKLTHPSFEIEKEYKITLDRKPGDEIKSITKGIRVGKDYLKASSVRFGKGKTIFITLKEGKNREIRRMLGSLGYNINRLIRIRTGNIEIGNLKVGRWRKISTNEISELKRLLYES
jgi:pseudouridine synthase